MSRSFDLCSPAATKLPTGLERHILRVLEIPPGRWLHVGNDIPAYGGRIVCIPPRELCRALRQKGWPERAIRAVVARLHTYHQDPLDHRDLILLRRAFRHNTRQMIKAQRFDELSVHPHYNKGWWD